MRYIETIRVQASRAQSIAEFLATNSLMKELAAGVSPVDWLASEFLPDAGREEEFEAWIARQVGAILETTLQRDTMSGCSHVAKRVSGVVMDPADQNWLLHTLGRHPVVLGVWRSMLTAAIAA
jgi:hypothetical protein